MDFIVSVNQDEKSDLPVQEPDEEWGHMSTKVTDRLGSSVIG